MQKEFGDDKFDIVVPSLSVLAEPPVAVVEGNAKAKGNAEVAKAYLEFLYSPEGQELAAKHFYRPAMPPRPIRPTSPASPSWNSCRIDTDFGGWAKAQKEHFADGGDLRPDLRPTN